MPSIWGQGVAVRGAGKTCSLAGAGVRGSRGAGDGAAWGGCASRRCSGPVKPSRMRAAAGRAEAAAGAGGTGWAGGWGWPAVTRRGGT